MVLPSTFHYVSFVEILYAFRLGTNLGVESNAYGFSRNCPTSSCCVQIKLPWFHPLGITAPEFLFKDIDVLGEGGDGKDIVCLMKIQKHKKGSSM